MNNNNINSITRADVELFGQRPFLHEYQRIATKSAIYPGRGTMLGLSYVLHKMAGEAGEANEHFGKAQRDDGLFNLSEKGPHDNTYLIEINPLTPERHAFLVKELGDVLWYLSATANELGVTLAEVAMTNLEKLSDRTERNKLQGSGDER